MQAPEDSDGRPAAPYIMAIRFLKRAAADPPSLPDRIASTCFSIHNIP